MPARSHAQEGRRGRGAFAAGWDLGDGLIADEGPNIPVSESRGKLLARLVYQDEGGRDSRDLGGASSVPCRGVLPI